MPLNRLLVLLLFAPPLSYADVRLTEGTNIRVDVAADGRIAMDLLGRIWVLPDGGGDARALTSGLAAASRPRWSPDGSRIALQSNDGSRDQLRLLELADGSNTVLRSPYSDRQPDWHPDGERLVFSRASNASGYDLWEVDLPTGLSWRLSGLPGDESEPAWSADGRDLVYVHAHDGQWALKLRRFGQPDRDIVRSEAPIAAPSWRPDGSLVSYFLQGRDGWQLRMVILSDPVVDAPLASAADFFLGPLRWPDRSRFVYAADGHIYARAFDSWTPERIPFAARIAADNGFARAAPRTRELPAIDRPRGRSIVRVARLFDGIAPDYRGPADIVIQNGRIVAVEAPAERPNDIVIDLGDVTAVPGLIDAWAHLPRGDIERLGPRLLAFGVTTLVAEHPEAAELDRRWAGSEVPGPRLLPAAGLDAAGEPWLVHVTEADSSLATLRARVRDWQSRGTVVLADGWQAGIATGATLLLGFEARPASPAGRRYADLRLANRGGTLWNVSALADAGTPGVSELAALRAAAGLRPFTTGRRHAAPLPDLAGTAGSVILGSAPNGLPPGIAQQAELRALAAAGLDNAATLRAAGVDAAAALGLGLRVGRIAPGAEANFLLVDGDPLADLRALSAILAVVQNGRFHSLSGLLDRAAAVE